MARNPDIPFLAGDGFKLTDIFGSTHSTGFQLVYHNLFGVFHRFKCDRVVSLSFRRVTSWKVCV